MSITLLVTIITALVSYRCFENPSLKKELIHFPFIVKRNKEYHRWISSGFIHKDWVHLIVNMIVFFSFGIALENQFVKEEYFGPTFGPAVFLLFYILAIVASDLPYYAKYKDNSSRSSLGASGGTAAVLFASMMFEPWNMILFYFIPVPHIIAGVIYLAYETYSHRQNNPARRINHLAHIFGAIFGVLALFALKPSKIPDYFDNIINVPFF